MLCKNMGIIGVIVALKAFRITQNAFRASKLAFVGEVFPLFFPYVSAHSCKASTHMSMQGTTIGARCCGVRK